MHPYPTTSSVSLSGIGRGSVEVKCPRNQDRVRTACFVMTDATVKVTQHSDSMELDVLVRLMFIHNPKNL